ncbi:hypothetical protein [Bordetella genomosp. 13]|uniref:Uncharacterized protein n=1 Tax=Bordetella genomosp. 13 TaxID=463040 RepID=A0A1W6ZES9_9BORD|nr:hypothetical protein [Bordetella genomosp. 13]ARP95841.1 hypothetical protein CAL15_16520 [Bordetella genomosp. 13]
MNKKLAFSLLFPLVLAACGGSSDDDDGDSAPTTPPPAQPEPAPVDAITQASQATASALGLAPISGNDESVQVYDVIADIGDTWQLSFNTRTGAFSLKVIYSAYGLTDATGTFTHVTSGSFSTFTGAGGAFTLLVDHRTRTISGTMKVGEQTASVTGSSYSMPADLAVFAGTYAGLLNSRMQPGGDIPPEQAGISALPGTLLLRTDGTGAMCVLGQVTAEGECGQPGGGEGSPTMPGTPVQLAWNAADGQVHLRTPQIADSGPVDLGIVRVQAGDRGAILTTDVPLSSATGSPVTGTTYFVKQQALQGTEMNGSWTCSGGGLPSDTLVADAPTIRITSAEGETVSAQLYYNGLPIDSGEPGGEPVTAPVFNGFAGTVSEQDASVRMYVPMSSSLLVSMSAGLSAGTLSVHLSICHPAVN